MMDEDGYLMDEGGWIKWGWWLRVVFMEMLSFASWVSNDIHEAHFFVKQQTFTSLQYESSITKLFCAGVYLYI